jgi:hypothetical protein
VLGGRGGIDDPGGVRVELVLLACSQGAGEAQHVVGQFGPGGGVVEDRQRPSWWSLVPDGDGQTGQAPLGHPVSQPPRLEPRARSRSSA